MVLSINSSFDMKLSKERVKLELEVIQRHANAGTDGRRKYRSDQFATQNYKEEGP